MKYDNIKVGKLYDYLDTLSIRKVLETFGHTSESNRFFCIGHSENIPSLDIREDMNIWHCHSCGKGGKIGDLIAYYYKTNSGVNDKFRALELFLMSNEDIKLGVGFSSLKDSKLVKKEEPLESIIRSCDNLLKTKNRIEELDLKSNKIKNNEELLNYFIKLQKGYKEVPKYTMKRRVSLWDY